MVGLMYSLRIRGDNIRSFQRVTEPMFKHQSELASTSWYKAEAAQSWDALDVVRQAPFS